MNLRALSLLATLAASAAAQGGPGTVLSHQKISETQGGYTADLFGGQAFASSVAVVGDVDQNGVVDLAVGLPGANEGTGSGAGAVDLLFRNPDGTVASSARISSASGGLATPPDFFDHFGKSVAGLGDLDGDGTPDVAVGTDTVGRVYVLLLHPDGSVKTEILIGPGSLGGEPDAADWFGDALAFLGDVDGDGVGDLAVGATRDDDGGQNRGAVYVLFLNGDGSVKASQKISDTQGGFEGTLQDLDAFGTDVAALGDLDLDGVPDLAVSPASDPQRPVFVLFLRPDGTVRSHAKVGIGLGGFTESAGPSFGMALAGVPDLSGDGLPELAAGEFTADDGQPGAGAVWLLFLDVDGSVKGSQKISATEGGLAAPLDPHDWFGYSVAAGGDLDGNGAADLVVGARQDDDDSSGSTFTNTGAIYTLDLRGPEGPIAIPYGCGVNPEGATTLISGAPVVGGSLTFGVDNQAGPQTPGSPAFVAVSLKPDPAFPCGTQLPGLSMFGPGLPGELLVSLVPGELLEPVLAGPPWGGPGLPSLIPGAIPNNPALVGQEFHAQGAILDPLPGAAVPLGLGNAWRFVIGP